MAQLAIAAAGALIGGATLGTGVVLLGMTGPAIGWAIGSMIGASFSKGISSSGPRLNDLTVQGTEYGQVIPWIAGNPRLAGQIIWASDKKETATTESAGKGGGGEYTSYSYKVDLLILLTENPILDVSRVWINNEVVMANGIIKSGVWDRITTYGGSDTQLPDPTYEAAVGVGNAPAYRGRGTVFIEGLDLGSSGNIPNLTFEIGPFEYLDSSSFSAPLTTGPQDTVEPLYVWYNIQDPHPQVSISYSESLGFTISREPDAPFYTNLVYSRYGIPPIDTEININSKDFYGEYSRAVLEFEITSLTSVSDNDEFIGQENSIFVYSQGQPFGYNQNVVFSAKKIDSGLWNLIYSRVETSNSFSSKIDLGPINEYYFKKIKIARDFITNRIYTIVNNNVIDDWYINASGFGDRAEPYYLIALGFVASGFGTAESRPLSVSFKNLKVYPENYIGQGNLIPLLGTDLTDVISSNLSRSSVDEYEIFENEISVRGLAISQISPTRNTLEQLSSAYFFDISKSDKIYFKPRATTPVVTIPYTDLGLSEGDYNNQEPLKLELLNELEVPAQVAIQYYNTLADYQVGTELSDRLLSSQESVSNVQLPLGLTPSEAKKIADVAVKESMASQIKVKLKLPIKYSYLEPTDIILVQNEDNSRTYRMRITRRIDDGNGIEIECISDDQNSQVSNVVTSEDYESQTDVILVADTRLELLDIPLLRDADDSAGYYVAGKSASNDANAVWGGASVIQSWDDLSYSKVADLTSPAIIGNTTSILPNFTSGNVIDWSSEVTVNVGLQQLSSSTRDLVLSDRTINSAIIGNEIVQFVNAELVTAGNYKLSGFLRGRLGTEWAMSSHSSNEIFVLLNAQKLRKVNNTNSQLGLLQYVKGVTLTQNSAGITPEEFTNTGRILKPLSPVSLRADYNTSGIDLTWIRRTRYAYRYVGTSGISAPLGEASEAYRVRIFSGTTLKRTEVVNSPEFTYTKAMQTFDGFVNSNNITVEISQMSQAVGAGYSSTILVTANN